MRNPRGGGGGEASGDRVKCGILLYFSSNDITRMIIQLTFCMAPENCRESLLIEKICGSSVLILETHCT